MGKKQKIYEKKENSEKRQTVPHTYTPEREHNNDRQTNCRKGAIGIGVRGMVRLWRGRTLNLRLFRFTTAVVAADRCAGVGPAGCVSAADSRPTI